MGADRINVVEGIAQDLGRGKVPNIPAEMGLPAAWEHDRKGVATKLGVTLAVTGALVFLVAQRRRKKQRVGSRDTKAAAGSGTSTVVVSRA
jgi:hypothetical protein